MELEAENWRLCSTTLVRGVAGELEDENWRLGSTTLVRGGFRRLSLPNLRAFHEHIVQIWLRAVDLPLSWRAGYIAPLPKSGDLADCSNWRGIMLLSVPGKLFARIIASRLQDYAESHGLLPEWQCGFRAGRSTIDMIFTIRMILESANHRKVPLFLLFVDLPEDPILKKINLTIDPKNFSILLKMVKLEASEINIMFNIILIMILINIDQY